MPNKYSPPTAIAGLERQRQLYLAGVAGQKPLIPADMDKLVEKARRKMRPEAFAYIAGGAGTESTVLANRQAFERWRIVPRMLRNVSERDTSLTLLDTKIPSPFLLAPIGVLDLAHTKGDLEVARAAATTGIPMIFSNQASAPMESCAGAMGDATRWFQLYWSKSDDLVASLVSRAEACGCTAILVTLDTSMLGWRIRDLDLAYLPFLRGMGIAQYTSDPVFQGLLDVPDTEPPPERKITLSSIKALLQMVRNYPGGFWPNLRSGRPVAAVRKFIGIYSRPSLTWENLSFLRDHTRLPVLLKGILHSDDAKKAVDYGMDGIIVTNHGGRQVDGAIGALDALPGVVAAVNGKIPVLLDSGVRSGADIFKAVALGAKAVCLGRPYAYALALAGQKGVEELIRNFMADFDLTMALAGCTSVAEITEDTLIRV